MTRSPLHDTHVELGARFVDFGGWEMPVQYESVLNEHRAVRESAGFFDVSHLGRFELSGSGAHEAIRRLLSNDIEKVEPARCQYSTILNSKGGIVDDLIVWWWGRDHFWVLPNAANHEKVMGLFAKESDCSVVDLQLATVMLAVQGPEAPRILEEVLGQSPGRFRNQTVEWMGGIVSSAGTGYTGEAGGELSTDPATGRRLMKALVEAGVMPCGLGSRDTLRLEAGLALWGEDIDETTTPLEAGLGFAVAMDHVFVGRDRLVEQKAAGLDRKLTGFILEERGIPRHGHRMRTSTGGTGVVTSGNMSPMLGMGVGLGYVSPPPAGEEGLEVEIRNRWVAARFAKPPFHKD